MAEAVKMGWMLLLLLLPSISNARQMPKHTFTSITLGPGQDMLGEYMMERNIPKVALNEKEKQASADETKPLLRADAAAAAGSSECSSTAWGLWVLLVLFSTGGLGFACNCYFKDSTVPAPSSAPLLTTNLTIQLGSVIAYNPPVHPVN